MIRQDDLHFRMPKRKIEYTQRSDMKWNVWCFRQNRRFNDDGSIEHPEDILHRWCLIAVVRNPKRKTFITREGVKEVGTMRRQ